MYCCASVRVLMVLNLARMAGRSAGRERARSVRSAACRNPGRLPLSIESAGAAALGDFMAMAALPADAAGFGNVTGVSVRGVVSVANAATQLPWASRWVSGLTP